MNQPRQLTLFELKRWSPTTVAVSLLLPASSHRSHNIAAALGKGIRRDGTFGPFVDGKDCIGVYVGPTQRGTIAHALGISRDEMSKLIGQWVKLNIAHRCARGVACLWINPFEETCPYCKAEPQIEVGKSPLIKRGKSPQRVGKSPRVFVPNTGDALRDGQGDTGSGSQELSEEQLSKAVGNIGLADLETERKRQVEGVEEWAKQNREVKSS